MKQSKLRRRRVIRFAILYYVMLVVFLALIVGPAVAGKNIPTDMIKDQLKGLPFELFQPNGQNRDNTNSTMLTGTGHPTYVHSTTEEDSRETDRIRLF